MNRTVDLLTASLPLTRTERQIFIHEKTLNNSYTCDANLTHVGNKRRIDGLNDVVLLSLVRCFVPFARLEGLRDEDGCLLFFCSVDACVLNVLFSHRYYVQL